MVTKTLSNFKLSKHINTMKSKISNLKWPLFVLYLVLISPIKCQSIEAHSRDNETMLNPVPKELITTQNVDDSDVVVVKVRCVVHAKYSESELLEMEKKYKNTDDWKVFYDDYLFYNEDVTMFLHERAIVKTESIKKYIQFIMATGENITVNRMKSAGKLFFFNPVTGLSQCDSSAFDQRKYTGF